MRIKYTGTELNKGGLVYALEEPDHQSMTGYTFNGLTNFTKTKTTNFDRKYSSVTFTPIDQQEFEYNPSDGLPSAGHIMGIAIKAGDPATPVPFHVEIVCHWEVIGHKTPVTSNPVGNNMAVQQIVGVVSDRIDYADSVYRTYNKVMESPALRALGSAAWALL